MATESICVRLAMGDQLLGLELSNDLNSFEEPSTSGV